MQIGNGGVSLSSELYSADGVLRGTDVQVADGNTFAGGIALPGSGTETSAVQLLNPAASGQLVIVDSVTLGCSINTMVTFFIGTVTLANSYAYWLSKLSSGGQGVGTVYWEYDAASPGNPIGAVWCQAGATITVPLDFGVQLEEGAALSVLTNLDNAAVALMFQGRQFAL